MLAMPKYKRLTGDEIADHAFVALRLSRNTNALKKLRSEILAAIATFLRALQSEANEESITAPAFRDSAPSPDRSILLAQAEKASQSIRLKPLNWFADKHDWKPRGKLAGAGFLIKMERRLIFGSPSRASIIPPPLQKR
jgi:hypothetical protein